MTFVYNLRWISEDTNPWDGNESYGMFSTLEAAQESGLKFWQRDSYGNETYQWYPMAGGVYTRDGYVDAWYLIDVSDLDEEDRADTTHVCGDYGMHITKEPFEGELPADASSFPFTDEQYEQHKEQQIERFIELLKAIPMPEGTWDGIIDWVLEGVQHPDVRS